MTCYEILRDKYNLSGYSPDTIFTLMETDAEKKNVRNYLRG